MLSSSGCDSKPSERSIRLMIFILGWLMGILAGLPLFNLLNDRESEVSVNVSGIERVSATDPFDCGIASTIDISNLQVTLVKYPT